MKIGIIAGSQRADSNSLKVGQQAAAVFKDIDSTVETFLWDLGANPLSLWDGSENALWLENSPALKECDAFVIISPEWGGMATATIKNFFLYCNGSELCHKPGLLMSVSAGIGGSYPITELRSSSYKNTQICYIPGHLIVRSVNSFLSEFDSPSTDNFKNLKERWYHYSRCLLAYGNALKAVRKDFSPEKFGNGL